MEYEQPLIPATLIRRYQRFLADVTSAQGEAFTVHCPNTGAMQGCQDPGSRVWLLPATNPNRKYPYSWELVEALPDVLVGINTGRSNRLVAEALDAGLIAPLRGYRQVRREVTVSHGGMRSRMDFLLSGHRRRPDCYLEVKNVTAAVDGGTALFPDAVSIRASKHLEALMALRGDGQLWCSVSSVLTCAGSAQPSRSIRFTHTLWLAPRPRALRSMPMAPRCRHAACSLRNACVCYGTNRAGGPVVL
jgi:sugar fermentation stimulation protein A